MVLRLEAFEHLGDIGAAAWDALVASCPESTIFQRFAWLDAWTQTVGKGRVRPYIIAAFEDSQLAGLAPLCIESEDGVSTVKFLGCDHSDYLLFPTLSNSPQIVSALLDHVERSIPRDLRIELHEIPATTVLARCLSGRSAASSSGLYPEVPTRCPRLQIGTNLAEARRITEKGSVRRSENKLRRKGVVTVEHFTNSTDIIPLLEPFFEQHVSRWKDMRFPSLFRRPHNREFYCRVAEALGQTRDVIFTVVWLDGHPVAQHFGLRSGSDLLWYKPTFDVAYADCSPGYSLLKSLILYSIDEQFDALDFTRGDESFKSRFASHTQLNCSYTWIRQPLQRVRARLSRNARSAARGLLRRVGYKREPS